MIERITLNCRAALIALCCFWGAATAQNPDIDALQAIHVHRNKTLDKPFYFLDQSAAPLSVAAPIALSGIGFLMKDTSLVYKSAFIVESMAVSAFITLAMKHSIKRPRPFERYPFIEKPFGEFSPSFPSGHTSNIFASATSISMAFPKWYVGVPAFIWAGGVGYSRLHSGQHYPSDVLVGAAVGAGSAWLSAKLNEWIFSTRKHPKDY
ncbi:MAG: phosphatase PAP2 family protein [Salibacteraceae bacterium]